MFLSDKVTSNRVKDDLKASFGVRAEFTSHRELQETTLEWCICRLFDNFKAPLSVSHRRLKGLFLVGFTSQ